MIITAKRQSGITIILAMLMIAAVLGAAATFSSFIIRQIQQSRLIDQSIQAYYYAESGSEHALFQSRKLAAIKAAECPLIVSGSTCSDQYGKCSSSDVPCFSSQQPFLSGSNGEWAVAVASEPETTIVLKPNESFQIDLFNPFLMGNAASNLGSFVVSSDEDANLYGEITNLTWLVYPTYASCPQSVPPLPTVSKGIITILAGVDTRITGLAGANINPDCAYILRLTNIDTETKDLTIKLFDYGANQIDIPSRLIIESTATTSQSVQRVTVRAPMRAPLSGLYDFVLFSEKEIVK